MSRFNKEVTVLNGQWNLHFVSHFRKIDAGVIEFCDNKIHGGDSDFRYVGDFDLAGGIFSGELKAESREGKPHSLFGFLNQFSIFLYGNLQSSQMDLTGYLSNDPSVRIKLRCTRRD